jgi:uncharacterized protein
MTLLMALDELTNPPAAVVLRGDSAEVGAWQSELDRLYDPRRLVLGIPAGAAGLPPALAEKTPPGPTVAESLTRSAVAAYLCRGLQCGPPLATLPALIEELRGGEGGAA